MIRFMPRASITLLIACLSWLTALPHALAADAFTADELLGRANAAGEYFVRITDARGQFVYVEDPVKGVMNNDYNMLRHAGTTWAMYELYEVNRDEALLAAADRALSFLMSHMDPFGDGRRGKAMVLVSEDHSVKIGGNGLAILALTAHARATGSRIHLPLAERLGEWLTRVQDADGRFKVHIIDWPTQKPRDFRSEYYDGEAAFGLVRLYMATNDRRWLDAAEKAVHHLITVRDAGKSIDELPPDHWLLYALNDLHAARPDALCLEQARRLVERIEKGQHVSPPAPAEWAGGWYDPPRSTPAACRSEGLAAAWQMFTRAGEHEFAASIRRTIEAAVAFQLRCQVTPEMAKDYVNAARVPGGFRGGPTDPEIRIDYVQHNVAALLGARRLLLQIQ